LKQEERLEQQVLVTPAAPMSGVGKRCSAAALGVLTTTGIVDSATIECK